MLASQRRKCECLYFVRNDASEKEADGEANGAKEVDEQGYVLYYLSTCATVCANVSEMDIDKHLITF